MSPIQSINLDNFKYLKTQPITLNNTFSGRTVCLFKQFKQALYILCLKIKRLVGKSDRNIPLTSHEAIKVINNYELTVVSQAEQLKAQFQVPPLELTLDSIAKYLSTLEKTLENLKKLENACSEIEKLKSYLPEKDTQKKNFDAAVARVTEVAKALATTKVESIKLTIINCMNELVEQRLEDTMTALKKIQQFIGESSTFFTYTFANTACAFLESIETRVREKRPISLFDLKHIKQESQKDPVKIKQTTLTPADHVFNSIRRIPLLLLKFQTLTQLIEANTKQNEPEFLTSKDVTAYLEKAKEIEKQLKEFNSIVSMVEGKATNLTLMKPSWDLFGIS